MNFLICIILKVISSLTKKAVATLELVLSLEFRIFSTNESANFASIKKNN